MLLPIFDSMRYFFSLIVFFALFCEVKAQDVRIIQLKNEPGAYVPKSFYIAAVADSTHDSTGVGTINDAGKLSYIALQNGTATAIKDYIDRNIPQDTTAQPIALKIKKLETEVKKKGAKWSIKMSVSFVFSLDAANLELMGSESGETTADPVAYVDEHIRRTIGKELEQFEKWWLQNKDKFATSALVKVNVTLSKTTDKKNIIVYSLRRPLKQEDFQGKVQKDVQEKAMTASGNFFASSSEVQKGQTVFNVAVTPYFDRSESWFNTDNSNPYLLAHEQAHFDITAFKTCELVTAISKATFTKDNYAALFEQLRKQYLEEGNAEQDAYDTETKHGTIPEQQQSWQDKISKRVKEVGCY